MSNTNGSSNFATLEHHDTLADSELDAVTGRAFPVAMVQMALRRTATGSDKGAFEIEEWSFGPP